MKTRRLGEMILVGVAAVVFFATVSKGASFGPKIENREERIENRKQKNIELTGILEKTSDGKHDLSVEIFAKTDLTEPLFSKEFKGVEISEGFYTLKIDPAEAGLEPGNSYGLRITVLGEDVPVIEAQLAIVPRETYFAFEGEEGGGGITAQQYNLTGNYPYPQAVVTVTNNGTGYGISSTSKRGVGLYAESQSAQGYGLHAKNTMVGGTALKADGKVAITGDLTVSGGVDFSEDAIIDADTLDTKDSTEFVSKDGSGNVTIDGKLGVGVTPNYTFEVNKSTGNYLSRFTNLASQGGGLQIHAGSPSLPALEVQNFDESKNLLVVEGEGNVGIGVNPPAYKFDVAGQVNAVEYLQNGLPFTGSLWKTVEGGTDIYYDQGKVGIGTSTPSAKLDVQGTLNVGVNDTGYDVNFYGADRDGRLFWDESKMALRAGQDWGGTHWNDINVGLYSFATGDSTTASGNSSTAMGQYTIAGGNFSTAMGVSTTASGSSSTAMGSVTTASGAASTAMGVSTTASGSYSTAMGSVTTASGASSTAMGEYTTASGDFSTAIGRYVTVDTNAMESIVLGKGYSYLDPLVNNIPNSFMVGFNDTTPTLFVNSSNVGIGTTTPSSKLEVAGDIRLTGTIYGKISGTADNALRWDGHGWGEVYPNSANWDGHSWGEVYPYSSNSSRWDGRTWGMTYPYSNDSDQVDGIHGTQFLRNDQSGTLSGNLTVNGTLTTDEIIVDGSQINGADFVFADDYKLRSLNEVEQFIRERRHLPEIPSTQEMQSNGVNVSEMQTKLLQKVEELTLYVIDLKKENEFLKEENKNIKESITELMTR